EPFAPARRAGVRHRVEHVAGRVVHVPAHVHLRAGQAAVRGRVRGQFATAEGDHFAATRSRRYRGSVQPLRPAVTARSRRVACSASRTLRNASARPRLTARQASVSAMRSPLAARLASSAALRVAARTMTRAVISGSAKLGTYSYLTR